MQSAGHVAKSRALAQPSPDTASHRSPMQHGPVISNQARLRTLDCRAQAPLMLQRKLEVGAVDDPLEREADEVADRVMRIVDAEIAVAPVQPMVSRKCAECEEEDKKEDDEKLRMKPAAGRQPAGVETPPIVHEVLRRPGEPLDAETRTFFEPRFGCDFSSVRVHADSRAAESAGSLGASAYTAGSKIAFARGRYAPATPSGRRLLAHELAHVVQQRSQPVLIRRDATSDDYRQGYQDGLNGSDPQPGPRDGDAVTDYSEGYAKGHYEFTQQSSSIPAPGPAQPPSPAPSQMQETGPPAPSQTQEAGPTPAPSPAEAAPAPVATAPAASADYQQGYKDGVSGGDAQPVPRDGDALTDYNEGYAKGHHEFTQQSSSAAGPVAASAPTAPGAADADKAADLDRQFKGWEAERNWPLAAEVLNAFNYDDLHARLTAPDMTQDEIASLHQGALDNPRLGRDSQIALLTLPGKLSLPAGTSPPMGGDLDEYKSNPDYIDNFAGAAYDPSSKTLHLFFDDGGEAVLPLPLGRGNTNTVVLAFEKKSLLYNPGPNDQKIYPTIQNKNALPNVAQWLAGHAEEMEQSDLLLSAGTGAAQARSLPRDLWWLALGAPAAGLGARFLAVRMRPSFGTSGPEPGEIPVIKTPTPADEAAEPAAAPGAAAGPPAGQPAEGTVPPEALPQQSAPPPSGDRRYNLGGEGEKPGFIDVNAMIGNRLSEAEIRARNPTGDFIRADLAEFLQTADSESASEIYGKQIPSMALGKDPGGIASNMKRVLASGGKAQFNVSSPIANSPIAKAFEAAGFVCKSNGCSFTKQ
jgi:hypothetical protein